MSVSAKFEGYASKIVGWGGFFSVNGLNKKALLPIFAARSPFGGYRLQTLQTGQQQIKNSISEVL